MELMRCPPPWGSGGHDFGDQLRVCAASSPWLASICADHDDLISKLEADASGFLEAECTALAACISAPLVSDVELDAARELRARIFASVALCDLTHRFTTSEATEWLSRCAELCIQIALNAALRSAKAEACRRGRDLFQDLSDEDPQQQSGLVVYAVGKLGAGTLNYSSDIDFVIFHDSEQNPALGADPTPLIRCMQDVIGRLQKRTSAGYFFRTDVRLRPDPASTPVVISLNAAERYYTTRGQNWERAAMIRARPVAGDSRVIALADDLLSRFIWRRNLDFVAIGDIMAMKSQINTHAHQTEAHQIENDATRTEALMTDMRGFNVKIGIGGIREIEFFVQTQQLIYGGRLPEFRGRKIEQVLEALAHRDLVPLETAAELCEAWWWLRDVEHRLQIVRDEQTHSLPESDSALEEVAQFCGYETAEAFGQVLEMMTRRVRLAYGRLFAAASPKQDHQLVFMGVEPETATLKQISEIGFSDPEKVWRLVVGWHRGTYRCLKQADARALLTQLHSPLLHAFAGAPRGRRMESLLRFDAFLEALPPGMQPFALLLNTPSVLNMLVQILAAPTDISQRLAIRPALFESLISDDFWTLVTSRSAFKLELERLAGSHGLLEEQLEAMATLVNDTRFQCQVHALLGGSTADEIAASLTALAETAIVQIQEWSEAAFTERHGSLDGGALCLIAVGKFGGGELSPFSDLDLIPIATRESFSQDEQVRSNGAMPLTAMEWGIKLTMRVITNLGARTRFGDLYSIDTRLRPQGQSGPPASSRDGFVTYFKESAWTWEHMALTRARPITGPPELRQQIVEDIRNCLCQKRDPDALLKNVREMRTRIKRTYPSIGPNSPSETGFSERNFSEDNLSRQNVPALQAGRKSGPHMTEAGWCDVKHMDGGIVDIEFLTQYLQLRYAHDQPNILHVSTQQALRALGQARYISSQDALFLSQALSLWLDLSIIVPLISYTESAVPFFTQQVNRCLQTLGFDTEGLKTVEELAQRVRAICSEHLGPNYDRAETS